MAKRNLRNLIKQKEAERKKARKAQREAEQAGLENVLVAAAGKSIWIVDHDYSAHKIAERDNKVNALCSHDSKLYDGGDYAKVLETLTGNEIASRQNKVYTLCSHNGQLYDGGLYPQIFETLTGKEISAVNYPVRALCSHKGKMYLVSNYMAIFEVLTRRNIRETRPLLMSLCSHNGEMYNSEDETIRKTFCGQEIAKGNRLIHSLCSHNGQLYSAKANGHIYEVMTKKRISVPTEDPVTAMCSHPRKAFVEAGILK